MSTGRSGRRLPALTRRRWLIGSVVLVCLVVVALPFARQEWRRHAGQGLSIPGGQPSPPPPATVSPSAGPHSPGTAGVSYVSAVSPNGRYLLDQNGDPILIKGDAPWSLLTDLAPDQAELWFSNRQRNGFNAAIVSLIGAVANGGPSDDGATFDGVRPFIRGDVTAWNDEYWSRAHSYLEMAARHGLTVMLYPIDGWTIGRAFDPENQQQCFDYGAMVAREFADLPNIVWMTGGDYFPRTDDLARGSDVDHCVDAMVGGIRSTDDQRPFSIQLGYPKSVSTENPFWAGRVGWNFVYTYHPTYRAMLDAYQHRPPIPAVLGEANYEGENNYPETPDTTNETLRRQTIWALTSGGAGDFRGSADWRFEPGWEERLDTEAVSQLDRIHRLFEGLRWWELQPDLIEPVIIDGRGTYLSVDTEMDVLDNDYATAARTADGRLGVLYLPTERAFTIDLTRFAPGSRARWVDPASGESTDVPLASQMSTPGKNHDGNGDWMLVIQAADRN